MKSVSLLPLDINKRLDEMISLSWNIFINHFINKKYEINLEAPFQLHFASILKHIGEMYCLQKQELFFINLEVDMGLDKKNYVDIVVSFYDRNTDKEISIPIELKYKTEKQSAEDVGALEIYKDIYNQEKVLKSSNKDKVIPFSYFFCITDNRRYVNEANKGLKTVFTTHDGSKIKSNFEYKYLDTKTGKEFYDKYGLFIFDKEYEFNWEEYTYPKGNSYWFLKMRID